MSGAISVVVGAFAAHGIDLRTEAGAKAREWLQTGSQYEMLHALAILAVAALSTKLHGKLAVAAQVFFLLGSVLFPGALYGLAFDGPRWLGAVAPIGGTAFILGWLCVALAAVWKGTAGGRQANRV